VTGDGTVTPIEGGRSDGSNAVITPTVDSASITGAIDNLQLNVEINGVRNRNPTLFKKLSDDLIVYDLLEYVHDLGYYLDQELLDIVISTEEALDFVVGRTLSEDIITSDVFDRLVVYIRDQEDLVFPTDIFSVSYDKSPINEDVTNTETTTYGVGKNPDELLTTSETFDPVWTVLRTFLEEPVVTEIMSFNLNTYFSTDNATVSEVFSSHPNKMVSENLVSSEVFTVSLSMYLDELITSSEDFSFNLIEPNGYSTSDTSNMSEEFSTVWNIFRDFEDLPITSEIISKTFTTYFSDELVSLSETFTKDMSHVFQETSITSETVACHAGLVFSENTVLSETFVKDLATVLSDDPIIVDTLSWNFETAFSDLPVIVDTLSWSFDALFSDDVITSETFTTDWMESGLEKYLEDESVTSESLIYDVGKYFDDLATLSETIVSDIGTYLEELATTSETINKDYSQVSQSKFISGLTLYWRCETTTMDATHDYTANDTTWAVQVGSPSLDPSAAKTGTNGFLNPANSGYTLEGQSIFNPYEGSMGTWVNVSSSVALDNGRFMYFRSSAGFSSNIYLSVHNNNIRFSINKDNPNGSVTSDLTTTGNLLIVDTWYFVIIRWDKVFSRRKIEIYNSSMTLIDSAFSELQFEAADYGAIGQFHSIRFGNVGSVFTGYLDNLFISTKYDEPIQDFADISSYTEYTIASHADEHVIVSSSVAKAIGTFMTDELVTSVETMNFNIANQLSDLANTSETLINDVSKVVLSRKASGLTLFWRCESETLDGTHDYSAGDTTWSVQAGTPTLEAGAARVGSNGFNFDAVDMYLLDLANIYDRDIGSFGLWLKFTTASTGEFLVFRSNLGASTGSQAYRYDGLDIQMITNENGGAARSSFFATTGNTYTPVSDWYFVVGRWDWGGSRRKIEIYNNSMTLIDSAFSDEPYHRVGVGTEGHIFAIRLGSYGGASAGYIDNFFISQNYDEPIQDNALITSYTEYSMAGSEVVNDNLTTCGQVIKAISTVPSEILTLTEVLSTAVSAILSDDVVTESTFATDWITGDMDIYPEDLVTTSEEILNAIGTQFDDLATTSEEMLKAMSVYAGEVSGLTFFWRCEGTTLDGTHDYSAGDTTATLDSGTTISSAQPMVGTNSLALSGTSDSAIFAINSNDLISPSAGAIGFWVRIGTQSAGAELFSAWNLSTPSNNIRVFMDASDASQLKFQYRSSAGDNNQVGTTIGLTTGTWYFIVARWHYANSDIRLEIYDDTGTLLQYVEDLSSGFVAGGPAGLDTLQIGTNTGANIGTTYFDNVFIADTYNAPLQHFSTITSYTQYQRVLDIAATSEVTTKAVGKVCGESSGLTFFWRCEGTTLDGTHDFSLADTIATSNGSPTISSAVSRVGSNSILLNDNDDEYFFDDTMTSVLSRYEGAMGLWVRYASFPSGGNTIIESQQDVSANNHARIYLDPSYCVCTEYRATGVGAYPLNDTTPLEVSTWYFLVYRWDQPSSLRKLEIYNNDMSLRSSTQSSSSFSAATGAFDILLTGGQGSNPMSCNIDNIFVSLNYDEPLQHFSTIASYTEYVRVIDAVKGYESIPKTVSSHSGSVSGLTFYWRCESGTLDGTHDYAVESPTYTVLATPTYGTNIISGNGLNFDAGDQARFATTTNAFCSPDEGCVGFWANISAANDGGLFIYSNASTGENLTITLYLSGGKVQAIFSNGAPNESMVETATAGPLALNTPYFIVFRWNHAASYRELFAYDINMSLLTSASSNATWTKPTLFNRHTIGSAGGASAGVIDNVFISNKYWEPVERLAKITSYTEYKSALDVVTHSEVYVNHPSKVVPNDEPFASSYEVGVTTVTRYVNPHSSGGDGTTQLLTGSTAAYASLSAWNTARTRDLVAANEIEEVVCETDGNADVRTSTLTLSTSWITDATHYVSIKSGPNDRAGSSWDTSKYRLQTTLTTTGTALVLCNGTNPKYVKLDGLQIEVDLSNIEAPTRSSYIVSYNPSALTGGAQCTIKNNFLRNLGNTPHNPHTADQRGFNTSPDQTGADPYPINYIYNNIIQLVSATNLTGTANYAINNEHRVQNSYIYNNTIVGPWTHGISGDSTGNNRLQYCYNNLISGASIEAIEGTHDNTRCDFNATNLSAMGYTVGAGDRVSQTFTFVSSTDFALTSSDTGAKGYGTTMPGNTLFNHDLKGYIRPQPWDIGAVALNGVTMHNVLVGDTVPKHASVIKGAPAAASPVTDSFTNTNGTTLTTHSANWTVAFGNFTINSNALYPNDAGDENLASRTDSASNSDQYAQCTVVSKSASARIGLAVRVTGSYGYSVYWNDNTAEIAEFLGSAGSWTQLGSALIDPDIGMVVKLVALGSNLYVYYDNVLMATRSTDGSITGGNPGVSGYESATDALIDDWSGGTSSDITLDVLTTSEVFTKTISPEVPETLTASETFSVSLSNNQSDNVTLTDPGEALLLDYAEDYFSEDYVGTLTTF